MAASLSGAHLANLLTLPARHFAVVDLGEQRARILHASVTRGRPKPLRFEVVDSHLDGFTTAEELREETRRRLRESEPEAVILVVPQYQVLRHTVDAPAGTPAETRAVLEREANNIGGLSDSPWVFDAVRTTPESAGKPAQLTAAFCRQDNLEQLLSAVLEESPLIFDVRPAGDALATAFVAELPGVRHAVLIDLGAQHTVITILAEGRAVSSTSFPSGSAALTAAILSDRGGTSEAAEVLKRTEPPALDAESSKAFRGAMKSWTEEIERTVAEWASEHRNYTEVVGRWPAYLAGGGALQPRLADDLNTLGKRRFERWPKSKTHEGLSPDFAVAWGAIIASLGLTGPSPSLLPVENKHHWQRQRLWRALLTVNLALIAMLTMALIAASAHQTGRLAAKVDWKIQASAALKHAQGIREVAEGLNTRMDEFRPVLERQRQTVETLQVLGVLQRQRTNADHWYVLLADSVSYAAGSNHFVPPPPPPKFQETRYAIGTLAPLTNAPPPDRAFIAEVCLVPQGEQMRQALSDLVGELKRYPLFRNVDVLPSERRREWIATNLIFPERHFALEFNLSQAELLQPWPLPRLATTNREPRTGLRIPIRSDLGGGTNTLRGGRRP
ncbi:MAG: hypothetical protein IT581_07720 [Verrucomicrobiales bacterium]|nr:hypothetical protein [Verrucomicrobiales bacterium]